MASKTLIPDTPLNRKVLNFYLKDNKAYKVPGTDKYNISAIPNPINWATRYYGLTPDGTFTKKAFCHSNGSIYVGSDTGQSLTEVETGLSEKGNPESVTMQVAGRSRMYFFNGYDTPRHYEGNVDGKFTESGLSYKFVQGIVHNERLWAFERNSSRLYYSRVGDPENFTSTYGGNLLIGNEVDSYIRRIIKLGEYIYVFKNNGIFRIEGNTQSTYSPVEVVPNKGLIAQKAVCKVRNALVFVCQQDREIYQFGGNEYSLEILTPTRYPFSDKVDSTSTDTMCCIEDTRNKFFRLSYKNKEADVVVNNHEVGFYTAETGSDGKPKWFETKGARIGCYSMWDRQGDFTLVTGCSDVGRLMYHNRSSNWDDEPMVCKLRLDKFIPKDGYNAQFDGIFIKGSPSSGTFTLRTYLNERLETNSTSSSQTIDDKGETTAIGSINLPTQERFYNYIPLLTGYNYGENIGIEIYDNTADKEIMIEEIVVYYTVRSKMANNLIG